MKSVYRVDMLEHQLGSLVNKQPFDLDSLLSYANDGGDDSKTMHSHGLVNEVSDQHGTKFVHKSDLKVLNICFLFHSTSK